MPPRAARAGAQGLEMAPGAPVAQKTVGGRSPHAYDLKNCGGREWRLWFPARLGPPRKRDRVVAGHRVKVKVRALELPPSPNGSRGNPYGHAAWVKEWRAAAKQAAQLAGIPQCTRIRVSLVVYRRAIGTADEDNDRSRAKPLVDGLRDAQVIAKDTRAHMTYGACTEQRAGVDGPGILMIVEEV